MVETNYTHKGRQISEIVVVAAAAAAALIQHKCRHITRIVYFNSFLTDTYTYIYYSFQAIHSISFLSFIIVIFLFCIFRAPLYRKKDADKKEKTPENFKEQQLKTKKKTFVFLKQPPHVFKLTISIGLDACKQYTDIKRLNNVVHSSPS